MREDLSAPQQAVQCSHAAIDAATQFDFGKLPDHPYLVVLGVKNQAKLHRVTKYLVENGVGFVHFYENDLDPPHQLTAIATQPVPADCAQRALFRKYQCLKERREVLIEAA